MVKAVATRPFTDLQFAAADGRRAPARMNVLKNRTPNGVPHSSRKCAPQCATP
jgi:hypothetical protein